VCRAAVGALSESVSDMGNYDPTKAKELTQQMKVGYNYLKFYTLLPEQMLILLTYISHLEENQNTNKDYTYITNRIAQLETHLNEKTEELNALLALVDCQQESIEKLEKFTKCDINSIDLYNMRCLSAETEVVRLTEIIYKNSSNNVNQDTAAIISALRQFESKITVYEKRIQELLENNSKLHNEKIALKNELAQYKA
jgi:chromosome segregation ATPase